MVSRNTCRRRDGFTLVEILISVALSALVVGAVLSVVLVSMKTLHKNRMLGEAAEATRVFQEHLTREINLAVKKDTLAGLGLEFGIGDGGAPERFAQLTYRVPVCNPVPVVADAAQTATELVLEFPPRAYPAVGDYIVVPVPNTGKNLRISSVATDPDPTTQRAVKVTLNMKIEAATVGAKRGVAMKTYVTVYRERKYEVDDPGKKKITSVLFWENAADVSSGKVLVNRIPAASRYLFERIPSDPTVSEHAVGWSFAYRDTDAISGKLGGRSDHWESNKMAGVLWARSGDPQNPSAHPPSKMSTSVSSTSTTKTTTTKATTTVGPSTTKVSTTKATTTKATTTKGPTTTKAPTTTKPPTTKPPTTKPQTTIQDG